MYETIEFLLCLLLCVCCVVNINDERRFRVLAGAFGMASVLGLCLLVWAEMHTNPNKLPPLGDSLQLSIDLHVGVD